MITMRKRAAAGALLIGLLAGCGGFTQSHTQFPTGAVSSVSIDPASATLSVGGKQAFTVKALDGTGRQTNAGFTFSTFDPSVATVDAAGVVTAVAPGGTSLKAVETSTGMVLGAQITVTAGAVIPSFDRDIKSIATNNCSCHMPGGSGAGVGSMADYTNVSKYVVAGNPQGSLYLQEGTGANGHPGGNAWAAFTQKVSDWIQQGAKP